MRSLLAMLASVTLLAPACAIVWGFEEGRERLPDGGGIDGTSSSSSGGSSSGGFDVDASTPIPDGCKDREAGPGLFVDSVTGSVDGPCSMDQPCRSLQYAIDRVDADDVTIHVADGTYNESIHLGEAQLGRGLRIEGRWRIVEGSWTPSCEEDGGFMLRGMSDPGADAYAVVVRAHAERGEPEGGEPEDVGDAGEDAAAPQQRLDLTLAYATVRSEDSNNAGKSSYAMFVVHGRVAIESAQLIAGHGAAGADGAPYTAAASGTGSDCFNDGANGRHGSAIAPGEWTENGWGVKGERSDRASAGDPGACCAYGGQPGADGAGGGASVALFLWDSTTTLTHSSLAALGGGGGGNGAPGQAGATAWPCKNGGGTGGTGSPAPGGATVCIVRAESSGLGGDWTANDCTLPESPAPGGTAGDLGASPGPYAPILP